MRAFTLQPTTLARRAHRWCAQRLIVDHVPLARTLFLAGGGRSGTTWLAEQITSFPRTRYVFEPFQPAESRVWAGRSFQQYLRGGADEPAIASAARSILLGRPRGTADRYNRTLVPRRRLIKEIRANLMLAWLRRQFLR